MPEMALRGLLGERSENAELAMLFAKCPIGR
jgi:hypothetical protein